jgi:predicted permease
LVSGNYYQTLGVTPAVGRPILASDDTSGAGVVGVISDGFWSRRFGRGLGVIGKRIEINRVPLLIVGVNPRGFTGADLGSEPEIFLPLSAQPGMVPSRYSRTTSLLDDPNAWWLSLIGHLEPSVSDARALSALEWAFQQAVQTTLPDKAHLDRPHLRLLNGSRGVDELRQAFGKPLFVLVGLAGFVLLLACANLANLLLARSGSRGREIGLRLALGAGRARVARQMLTEGLVLALFGGGAGLVAGYWVRNAIPSLLGGSWERVPFQAAFDGRVLAVSIGLTLITGILFSLAPAWQATRTPINTWLKDAGRATRRPSRIIGARPLIVLQVALSGVLLAGAGLFVRTLTNLNRADLGFRPDRLVLFAVDPPRAKDDGKRRAELFGRLEEAIRGISGVQAVGLSTSPLVGHDTSTTSVGPDGRAPRRGDPDRAWLNDVGREFFQTLGIPILQGRAFDEHDGPTSPPVVVVNRQFVRKFFPSGDALNHTVLNDGVLFRIVGVAGDTRFRDVRAPAPPTLFRPYFQLSDVGAMTFEIKTELGDAALVQAIRESMRTIDPDLPLGDVRSQRAQIDATLSQERMLATLTSTFGLLAIVLTCIGIYGVVANAVARRTAEIGIRMALGAQRHEVMRMILGEIAGSVGLGLAAGSVAILGVGRFLESLLYGVRPLDPPTITSAILLVLLTALAASSIPARRASRLSPTIALRHE